LREEFSPLAEAYQQVISEQTRVFVEDEFKDVLNPTHESPVAVPEVRDPEKEVLSSVDYEESKEDFDGTQLPILTISSA